MPYWMRNLDHSYGDIVRVASTANLSNPTGSPGSTIDGVTMTAGDLVLLKDQTTQKDNGIYVWFSSTSMIRHAALPIPQGGRIQVTAGTLNSGSTWTPTNVGTITPGLTALNFIRVDTPEPWQSVATFRGTIAAGTAAGTFLLPEGGGTCTLSTAAINAGTGIFHLDPTTNYVASGFTHQVRVVGTVTNSGAAQTGTFTAGLYPISALASTGIPTLGSVLGSVLVASSPGNGSMTTAYGSAISMPTAGHYCVGLVTSAAIAGSSVMIASAKLQLRVV